jgi:hypothetical protein
MQLQSSSPVRNAAIKRPRLCPPTLASCSMTARVVERGSSLSRATAACSAPTARCHARRSKRTTHRGGQGPFDCDRLLGAAARRHHLSQIKVIHPNSARYRAYRAGFWSSPSLSRSGWRGSVLLGTSSIVSGKGPPPVWRPLSFGKVRSHGRPQTKFLTSYFDDASCRFQLPGNIDECPALAGRRSTRA